MKQRMSIMKTGASAATLTGRLAGGEHTTPAVQSNMNSSFSAMNSSLSQKWISKKSQITGTIGGGTGRDQMSSTMAAGFGHHQPLQMAASNPQQIAQP
jgi:hypothetical protein